MSTQITSTNIADGSISADKIAVTGVNTATNLASGAVGDLPYQSAAGQTSFLTIGTSSQVLTVNSGIPSWADLNTLGAAGPQGPQGPSGANGYIGADGATGPQGPQGPTGPSGSNGTIGVDGATGPQGPQGVQGPQGPQGVQGPTGPVGTYVATGATSGFGLSGSANSSGATFTVTSNGTSTNTPSTLVFRDGDGNIALNTLTVYGDILPAVNNTVSLGSTSTRFKNLFVAANTIDIDGVQLKASAGGLTVEGQLRVNGTNANTVTNTSNSIYTAGGAWIDKSLVVAGDAIFTGNAVFQGTSTYVYSTQTVITDNLQNIHVPGPDNFTWTLDDGKDIGFIMHYYKGADQDAFLGWANDTGYLEWYDQGQETGSVYVGTRYGTFKTGSLKLTDTTAATNTSTGALTVEGGLGVGGAGYFQSVVTAPTFVGALTGTASVASALSSTSTSTTQVGFSSIAGSLLAVNTSSQLVGYSRYVLGGSAGTILFQSAANATSFVGPGSAGEVLKSTGGTAPTFGTLSANDLNDVDTATVAPTANQVLSWNTATSNWRPLDANTVLSLQAGSYTTNIFTATGTTSSFTIGYGYDVSSIIVVVEGITQVPSVDYVISGDKVVLADIPTASSIVQVRKLANVYYDQAETLTLNATNYETSIFTSTGVTASYNIGAGYDVNSILVTQDGVVQVPNNDYTISGSNIVFDTVPGNGVVIHVKKLARVYYIQTVTTATNVEGGTTGAVLYQTGPGATGFSSVLTLNATTATLSGSIVPSADLTYDLGSATKRFKSLYVGTSTIYIGDFALTVNTAGNLVLESTVAPGSPTLQVGPQGPQGPQGPSGANGVNGPQGPQGPSGSNGVNGPQGPQGVQGPQGPQGPTGNTGPQGPSGASVTGAQGPQGVQGPQGPSGPQGPGSPISTIFTITNLTGTVSTTTGALQVYGGVAVGGGIFIQGVMTATSIVETSSITLKENLNPITDVMGVISQLQGYTYDRKDGSRKNEPGLIAEDVDKVLPNIVSYDQHGQPMGINYTKLSVYLLEAIKSLKEEIFQLKQSKGD